MHCLKQFNATSKCPDLSHSLQMKRRIERVREGEREQEE